MMSSGCATRDSIAHGIYNRCPTLSESVCSLWPGTVECISTTAVRSDRPCILVSGLLDFFVTVFDLLRNHRGFGLNFQEIMNEELR